MSMDRRKFLATAGLFGSYGMAVDARRFLTDASAEPATGGDVAPPRGNGPPALADGALAPADEPHMRIVDHAVDVLVAGGGMAGVCAALAAARNGAKVLLVQDRSRLGGNASSEVRMHIVGADSHGSRAGWREGGLIEEIRLEDAVRNPHRAFELFDLTLYDLCMREANLALRLDTALYRVEKDGDRIARVWTRCDKTETIHRVSAAIYCDCTGDARLGLEAGAAFRLGREAKAEFGEELAQRTADPMAQGASILFTARRHEQAMPYVPPPWARKLREEDLLFRGIAEGQYEYGYWWIELGGDRDVITENEELRHELLRIVLGVWDWIKNSGEHPGSANWALETVGMIPGKRESRRLEGDFIQTQQTLEGGWKQRVDGVSIGGWAFDDHPPRGFDDWDQPPFRSRPIAEVYNVGLESLYSRNVSSSQVAFSSTRVMATCACLGQAIGTAAALAAREGLTPRALRKTRMATLQQAWLRDDQTIRGVKNADPEDLARRAVVTANAGTPGRPENVIDGEVRDLPGEWRHRWGATLEAGAGPAILILQWDAPVQLSEVQITFDSGFHRELTLSASNAVTARTIRGPQPETVRDYELVAVTSAGETVLAKVEGNYQRLRRHAFEPVRAKTLKRLVHATNGAKEARVFELRAFA